MAASTPFDLGKVIEQVHFAFRDEGGAWTGGHSTYQARFVSGALEVVPYHHAQRLSGERYIDDAPRYGDEPSAASSATEPPVEGSAIRLAGSRVTRGTVALASGRAAVTRNAQGQLELLHAGGVLEYLRNGADGVEQSWEFEQLPSGEGALDVRVPVIEANYVGATAGGLHLTSGKLGVRYGHATWIDAAGLSTPVEARWDGDAIALRVPEELLETSAYPAVLDPVISPEFAIDVPVQGPLGIEQNSPAVASDGGSYMVVWQDYRSGKGSDIFGARVSSNGEVLDAAGIPISTAPKDQLRPAVAWNGVDYLVVWQDLRSQGSGGVFTSWDIYGARVSASGAVRDPRGIAVSSASDVEGYPAVTSDGAGYLVAWEDSRTGPYRDIYGARVSADGTVQDGTGIPISTAANHQERPALTWNGTDYLVVWQDLRAGKMDVYGARVNSAGVVQDPAGIPISTAANDQYAPKVAWNGTSYLVVWTDWRNGIYWSDVYGARVSATGIVQDPAGFAISTATSSQSAPVVAWDGTNYLVVWADSRNGPSGYTDLYGARVSAAGEVQDTAGIPISIAANYQSSPALAWDGSHYLVAWQDSRGTGLNVFATRVSAAGAVQEPDGFAISADMPANEQFTPAVAWDGSNYLVVWEDNRGTVSSYSDIFGARVSASGVVQDITGIAISTAANGEFAPAVSWNGTSYLVVWVDNRSGLASDIWGARVSATGALQDANGFPISTAVNEQLEPAVASEGASYLVVWTDGRNGWNDIYGTRVGADGTIQDSSGIPISTAAYGEAAPAVAWDGTNYLVVWQDQRNRTTSDVYGARLSAAGAVLDPVGIPIGTAANDQCAPAVAWNGSDYLVVWEDNRSGTNWDLYGARVSSAGAVQDPAGIPVSTAGNVQEAPAVAWDGTSYLVAWADWRSGTSDIIAARVSADGVVQDADGILVSGSGYYETAPAMAASGPRRFLVAYSGWDPATTVSSQRTFARTTILTTPPVATPQAVATTEDTAAPILLAGSDADGDPLTYSIVMPPAHGTLTGTAPNLVYTSLSNFNGPDSFTFRVNDGFVDSSEATITIAVAPVNDPPVAAAQSVTTVKDTAVAVTPAAVDVDGDSLTYRVVTWPAHGTLSGIAPNLVYTPASKYTGADGFTFVASDGSVESAPATVAIGVTKR